METLDLRKHHLPWWRLEERDKSVDTLTFELWLTEEEARASSQRLWFFHKSRAELAVDMKEASDQDNQDMTKCGGEKWEFLHFSYDNSVTSEHVRCHGTAGVPDTAEMPLDRRTALIFHPGPDTLSPRCKNWS